MTVSVHTKMNGLKDEAQHLIPPFTTTGTPAELDEGFHEAMRQPMEKTLGLLTNMSAFEEQLKVAEANTKAAKAEKNRVAKEEKESKFNELCKKAREDEREGRPAEAVLKLREALPLASETQKREINQQIEAFTAKLNKGTLFGGSIFPAGSQENAGETDDENRSDESGSDDPDEEPDSDDEQEEDE